MSKTRQPSQHENRINYRVASDDVVVFKRHNRFYRVSNLLNNWIPGKLFVLINGNTTDGTFEVADRLNILHRPSRARTAKLFADLWQANDDRAIRTDLDLILEVLADLNMAQVQASTNPLDGPRVFGKPWRAKPDKLVQV